MSVRVIVPHGQRDDPTRVAARKFVVRWWENLGLPVTLAECPTPDWSKGAAVNPVAKAATEDVLVIADADSLVMPEHLDKAIGHARTCGWSMPHSVVRRLSRQATSAVYTGHPLTSRLRAERGSYPALPGGGIVVLTADAFATVNGLDPRFIGWGGEDHAFGLALRALVGPLQGHRTAPLWHLWHTPAARNRNPSDDARALNARYRAARTDAAAMADIVKEWQ